MAARRRTQEEKNLKTLRELASLPANKQCFDCRQRGPTYVNVTIGSFVCTSCSGILRGLNPPHRVKSITMTTFSMDEIEFIKSRGNEYCQYVWMGLYDSRVLEPESRDEQRIRDFMIQKYERKRWYVDPDIAIKKMQQDQQQRQNSMPSSSSQSNLVPDTQPLTSLLGNSVASLVVQHHQGNSNSAWPPAVTSSTAHQAALTTNAKTQSKDHSEFNSFDKNVFNSAKFSADATTANGNFANFESAFNTPALTTTTTTVTTQSTFHQRKACTPPAGWTSFDDDLDPLHSTSSLPSSSSSSHRQPNVPHPLPSKLSNNGTIGSSTIMPRPLSLPTFSPTNPFSPSSNKLSENSTPSQWPSFPVTASATVCSTTTTTTSIGQMDGITSSFPLPSSRPKNDSRSNLQPTSYQVQPPPADRYAALADLDNLFHQVPTSSSTSGWTASDTYLFGNTVTLKNEGTGSNPFGTDSLGWNKPSVTQQQPPPTFAMANPFQTVVSSSGIVSQPTTFGTCVEEGYAGFGGNTNFAAFPVGNIAGSPNGIPVNQFGGTQNGFGIRQVAWGIPGGNVGPWGSSVVNHQNVAQPTFSETKLEQSGSTWIQQAVPVAANPFLERNGATVPRTNPGNPFL